MKTNLYIFNFNSMKGFILKITALFLPLFLLLVVVNYFGDAAKLFHSDYEKKIASIINSGAYVTNIENYDDRILQKELIQGFIESPEIIVIGSSRTMLISKDLFISKTFFNNSVAGANLKDLIAIYQLYKENNILPRKIILGIDPWMFNNNESGIRWKSLGKYYNTFNSENNVSSNLSDGSMYKWSQLFSLSYFQVSVRQLSDRLKKNSEPMTTNSIENITNTKLSDGSLVYGEAYRSASSIEVENKINKYIEGDIYGMNGFDENYLKNLSILNSLCEDIIKRKIVIEFFLAPYPIKSYEALSKKYSDIVNLEKEIRKFADSANIRVIGSFNPNIFEFGNEFFYDGMHCKKEAIEKLIN